MGNERSLKGWSDIILRKQKTPAHFWYYGNTSGKSRLVRLYQNKSGTYTVDIEGMPALTRTVSNRDKAEDIFRRFYGMSEKDWGASEIEWGDWCL